jgi:hypothetical protein
MFGFRSHLSKVDQGRPEVVRYDMRMGGARFLSLFGCVLALACPAIAQGADPAADLPPATVTGGKSWAAPQIAAVVLAGVMGPDVASFRPDDPLTRGELHDAIVALGSRTGPRPTRRAASRCASSMRSS